ncbi:MAG: acyl-CoA dehydrogenase family protein [Proteobacteria bacterium]|nr:acyl-CoA dehydrogenase family protein [Pseudomonadota bacterium]
MDFNDTSEEAAFRAEARAFLEAHVAPLEPGQRASFETEDPQTVEAAQHWQALKKDNGWACLTWPVEYGGRGARPIESVIWNQEEARFRVPPNIFGIGIGMLGPTLMAHGTPEQRERYLQKMARGDEIWCQLFSEPGAGSDLAGLQTSAVRDGGDWRINGQKIWTSGAHFCRWGMIVTRTDPTAEKHDGLTYFIVDMKAPGVEIRPIRQINGGANFNQVFFSDVRVPDANRVDAVGNGWRVSMTTLLNERASVGGAGGGGLGVRDLIRLAGQLEIDGRPALEDSHVRQRIADFYVRLRGVQHTGNRTLTALSRGQTPGPEASISKLVTAPLAQQLASFAIELQSLAGGEMAASGFQDGYLGSPGMRIAAGTDEILRNILAERVLGLPREPRMDKGIPFKDIPTGTA